MFLSNPSMPQIIEEVQKLEVQSMECAILFIGEHCTINRDEFIIEMNKLSIDYFGGVFPSVIYGNQHNNKGILIDKIPVLEPPTIISNIEEIKLEPPVLENGEKPTTFVFIDGLTEHVSSMLSALHGQLGDRVNYIGGGAGSLSLKQSPCLFTADGWFQDVGIVCISRLPVGLGVQHGWKKIFGPLVATKTHKNIIYELNWQPAFDVYKGVVDNDTNENLTKAAFFDTAKGFPFGIMRESLEDIVRDPIAVGDSGELICVGDVPENAVLYILKGSTDSLVNAAAHAATEASNNIAVPQAQTWVIDCISRVLYLEEDFDKELEAVSGVLDTSQNAQPIKGMLTLGEISSDGDGLLQFFNKTMVIGVMGEG